MLREPPDLLASWTAGSELQLQLFVFAFAHLLGVDEFL